MRKAGVCIIGSSFASSGNSPERRSASNGLFHSLALLMFFALPAWGQTSGAPGMMAEGEELVYNVRYGFIDLGQVRIRTHTREQVGGYTTYRTKAFIDSYSGIPFVDLHATFESWIDTLIFPRRFVGKSKEGKTWEYSRYSFDYELNKVFIEGGRRDTIVEKRDTMNLEGRYQDGLSLFFFARDQLRSGKKMDIRCLVKEEKVNAIIDFKNSRTSVEIDPVEYPVDVIPFEGTMEFVGIYGLTGDFEGWFSNDEARVPIMAKMKVIIGSITIELMEWKRPGWIPPRGE